MANKTIEEPTLVDPRQAGPKVPEPQEQPMPGSTQEMKPKPDHGEQSYKGLGRMQGMATLITGGDSGIGRAVAIAYAREGADVAIAYLTEDQDAEETAHWVRDAGRKVVLIKGDISDRKHAEHVIERTFHEFKHLEVLVNNAAFQNTYDKPQDWTVEDFERAFRVNVFAMFYLCKAAMPRMKPGSAIINTASIQAFDPKPVLLGYSASKAAIVNFTKGLGRALNDHGIRVNAVAPGPVWTPLIPSTFEGDKVKGFGENTPFGRPAQPAEIAPAYVFLATRESQFMTGEVIGITGGKMPL
ncbi:MAG TPA: SDR family oxidoreductase [Bryobacteraceae bacterium]|jgi:NAD(P)-dependent dehydrogenase (short-subunit alcohol dehydrogenase family)|nr:SDR family oxidoreductase [Bryobacteraceae bacterium]